MVKEEEKKKKEVWTVGLTVLDEEKPPKKVMKNEETEETLDEWGVKAKIMNNLEKLMKLLD